MHLPAEGFHTTVGAPTCWRVSHSCGCTYLLRGFTQLWVHLPAKGFHTTVGAPTCWGVSHNCGCTYLLRGFTQLWVHLPAEVFHTPVGAPTCWGVPRNCGCTYLLRGFTQLQVHLPAEGFHTTVGAPTCWRVSHTCECTYLLRGFRELWVSQHRPGGRVQAWPTLITQLRETALRPLQQSPTKVLGDHLLQVHTNTNTFTNAQTQTSNLAQNTNLLHSCIKHQMPWHFILTSENIVNATQKAWKLQKCTHISNRPYCRPTIPRQIT